MLLSAGRRYGDLSRLGGLCSSYIYWTTAVGGLAGRGIGTSFGVITTEVGFIIMVWSVTPLVLDFVGSGALSAPSRLIMIASCRSTACGSMMRGYVGGVRIASSGLPDLRREAAFCELYGSVEVRTKLKRSFGAFATTLGYTTMSLNWIALGCSFSRCLLLSIGTALDWLSMKLFDSLPCVELLSPFNVLTISYFCSIEVASLDIPLSPGDKPDSFGPTCSG